MRFTMHVLFAFSHTHLGSQFIRKNFFFVEKKELQIFRRFSSFVVSSSARRLSAFDERQRRRRALRGCVLRFALAFRVEEEERFFFCVVFWRLPRERERETIRFDLNRIRVVFFSLSLFLSVSVSLFPDDDDDDDDDDEHSM